MRPARILMLRGGALGDFLVTLPALTALRVRWPDAHIEIIGYPHIAQLAVKSGVANHIRSIHDGALARYFAPDALIRDEDQTYFTSFDFIVNYLHDPEQHLAGNLKRCGVQVLISQSPLVRDHHAVEHFLQPLASLAIYEADPTPRLHIDSASARATTQPWLAIHPGSGSRTKNWPLENFIAIAGRVCALTGWQPVFYTGDAERAYIPGLDQALSGHTRHHNVELPRLSALLARAKLYIGNDSGISHLAAASGCRSLVLFGPSDPSIWAPRGDHVTVMRAPGGAMESLEVDEVMAALEKMIAPTVS